jgi:hypothetical protein
MGKKLPPIDTLNDAAKDVVECAEKFHKTLVSDDFARFKSWEHCYAMFHDAIHNGKVDVDTLALHLAFYLASWGMYRGSSFLLSQDYKVHKKVVEILLEPKYRDLCGATCKQIQSQMDNLWELTDRIKEYYHSRRYIVEKAQIAAGERDKFTASDVSDILISKVLMGTMGCVPAYDRFFTEGVKLTGATTGQFNRPSIERLIEFYQGYHKQFDKVLEKMSVEGRLPYPQMKLLDMGFWQMCYKPGSED